ncbi:hypothetical protein COV49_04490 [Candidatus Falkowbacteria bacterium CG11_big_fil_rev_8_21_14_0_20_39_10]|uniref:Prepilin-type N-terminal cleavage/methylation domain-containing protein n=1 Tax=Candidatus Falkowbacteria bacterium CG11_big_fil_rev_8_21_14_0_20_39_10 TaxID=1974570 RepID=A0A2M6K7W4_9BACT|nr:MAG: hypothetical protein COV49_04490 [Candidatus Falkowbacteria bacterium CG11_big_fil_rev_8_21_14_0_20_39_10]
MLKILKTTKKSHFGFTLIELIVGVSMLALVTGIFLANYHGTNKHAELVMEAQKLAANLRTAQSYSLESKKFNDDIPAGGWGIHFDLAASKESYLIFADIDEPEAEGSKTYDGEAEKLQEFNLPKGITIEEIKMEDDSVWDNVDISFLPPDPTTNIWDGTDNYNLAQITLKENAGNTTKVVEVNFFGLINVVD